METNSQISKFEERKKKIRLFNIIALTKAIESASKTIKKPKIILSQSKIDLKINKLKNNHINTKLEATINTDEFHNNSIAGFLSESHPDLTKFINTNEWSKIVASTERLIITTRNNFRITIDIISKYSKKILIKDSKKNIVFNGIQTVYFKEFKN